MDYLPDLTIARLPVHTETECTNVVNKILTYDRDPNTGNWYDDFLAAAYFQDLGNNGVADRWFMETAMTVYDFLVNDLGDYSGHTALCTTRWPLTYGTDSYHFRSSSYPHRSNLNNIRWGESPYPDPVPTWIPNAWTSASQAASDVSTAINSGVGIVQHRDHGGETLWADPPYSITNINNLSNGEKTPVVFSINCLTGSFHRIGGDCFCEAFIKKSSGGCVGIVGATRTSYSGFNDLLAHGIYTSFWPSYDPCHTDDTYAHSWRPAEALTYGKYYMLVYEGEGEGEGEGVEPPLGPDSNEPDYDPNAESGYTEGEFHMFHWFGDPEMMLRTKTPDSLSVSHPSAVLAKTSVNVTVTVTKDSNSLEDALVCISHPNASDHWANTTDANGSVTFSNIEFSLVDDYNVVVTAHDCIPYEGVITTKLPIMPIIYVDKDASGSNSGASWQNAFTDLQNGFGAAIAGSEIRVAEGTYKPTSGTSRTATFQLITGVTVKGGYAGYGEPDPNARDITGNKTTLSGDIDDNDVLDANNSYHVVTGTGTDANAVLDGFTVTAGYAHGTPAPNNVGAGLLNYQSGNPTVNSCTFTNNSSSGDGGAMYNYGANPTVTDCNFSGNTAGDDGGAVCNKNSSDPNFVICWFKDNTSGGGGGAIFNTVSSSPTFTSCMIVDNNSGNDGGGAHNKGSGSNPTYTNCTFAGNVAADYGGGMYTRDSSAATAKNCIFWGNTAVSGGNEIYDSGTTTTVTYSDVQGGFSGTGNQNIDPQFVDSANGDYHLQQPGVLNVVDGGATGDYSDQNDIDLEPRLMRIYVDMGADELDWPCDGLQQDGDADGDGVVEFTRIFCGQRVYGGDDYDKWWVSYNTATYNVCCDFDRDGDVDLTDRSIGQSHDDDRGSSCSNCQGP